MPIDGSGNFTRSYNWVADKAGGVKVVAARMDGEFDNYANALNQVFWRSGIVGMTGTLNMGANSISALASGSAGTPALRFSSDGSSGLYSPASGRVALSAGGVNRIEANSTGILVAGTFGVTGNTSVTGTFGVTGNSTLTGTLGVTSNATIGGTLGVTGNATFAGTLGVTGNTSFSGTVSVAGNLSASLSVILNSDQSVFWGGSNTAYVTGAAGAGGYLKFGTSGSERLVISEGGLVSLAAGAGLSVSRTAVTAPATGDGNVFSGTYTPSLAGLTNVTAGSASVAQYMRVGNVVTVSGRVQVDPTIDGLFDLAMSLPVASAVTDASEVCGVACPIDPSEIVGGPGVIYGDAATDRAILRRHALGSGNATYHYTFTYRVV